MAKATVKKEVEKKTSVPAVQQKANVAAVKKSGGLLSKLFNPEDDQIPEHVLREAEEHGGAGKSKRMEDNQVPMVYILQAGSPQVLNGHQEHIKGAAASMIWLKNAEPALIPGDEGIYVQVAHTDRKFVEWIVRTDGGGIVTQHEEMPDDVEERPDPQNKERMLLIRRSNGHQIVDTMYFAVNIYFDDGRAPLSYVIPFSSSGLTVARGWQSRMNGKTINGRDTSSWQFLYKLTTRMRTKNNFNWYMFEVNDVGWIEDKEMLARGKALHFAFKNQTKTAEKVDRSIVDERYDDNRPM